MTKKIKDVWTVQQKANTQIIGRCGCSNGIGSIHCPCNWKNYSSGVRKHFNHSLLEPYGRTKPRIESDTKCSTNVGTEAINNHVSITCCHVASDRLSRMNDRYEWQFHPELFNLLDTMRGPHTIDRIVFFKTAQTEVFIIRYYHPRSSGVNALVQQYWTLHNNFVNTPFRLMPEIQLQLNVQKADRTIIAPKCAKMKLW